REVVPAPEPRDLLLADGLEDLGFLLRLLGDLADGAGEAVLLLDLHLREGVPVQPVEPGALDLLTLPAEDLLRLVRELLDQVLPHEKVLQLLVALHLDDDALVLEVLLDEADLLLLDRLRPLVLVDPASREHLDVDDGAL